jgi:hydroxyacylglutathione hydrolase
MMREKHFGPILFIPGENKGKYPYCHSIYVEDSGILIDPSSDRERLLQLRKEVDVKEIWLSHWHEDHFMHLDLFDDIPLCIMEQDAPPLSDLELLMDSYGLDEEYKKNWRPLFNNTFHFKPRKPTRFLQDGDWIDLNSTRVKIISAPGHTPGHIALLFEEPNLLFMADYDLSGFGPWYGDVASSIEQTISSVNKLRKFPVTTWLTSHEKGIFEEEPGDLWDQYLGVIHIRENKLLNLLEKPKTFTEIVEACIVYKKPREPKYFFEFGEKAHMKKHLEKLISDNIVVLEDGRYCINT